MSTTPLQILQAEDDEDDRVLFAWAIKKAGIQADIIYAVDGAECLTLLENFIPDIIFLDINMAGMNGRECLKLLREQKQFDNIPVIMLTTSDHGTDVKDTFESGANLFMVKPFRSQDLVMLLKRIFADNWKNNLAKRDEGSYVMAVK